MRIKAGTFLHTSAFLHSLGDGKVNISLNIHIGGQRRGPLAHFLSPTAIKTVQMPTNSHECCSLCWNSSPLVTMPPLPKTIYTGTFIHTPHLGALSVAEHLAVGVDETGTIRHITNLSPGGRRHDRGDVVNERKRVGAVAVRWGWGEEEEEEEGGWRWVDGGREGGGLVVSGVCW